MRSVIIGTGCYIPPEVKKNSDFILHEFYSEDHRRIETPQEEVVEKFKLITGIEERRYVPTNLNASDIASISAKLALADSGIDPESLDQIIVAHNFGNVVKHTIQIDCVPSLASRVKHDLGIKNPSCVAYDILFKPLPRPMPILKRALQKDVLSSVPKHFHVCWMITTATACFLPMVLAHALLNIGKRATQAVVSSGVGHNRTQ